MAAHINLHLSWAVQVTGVISRTVLTTELFPPTLVKTHYWDQMQMEGKFFCPLPAWLQSTKYFTLCVQMPGAILTILYTERQVMKFVLVSVNFPR
jgi:hypothetical protein